MKTICLSAILATASLTLAQTLAFPAAAMPVPPLDGGDGAFIEVYGGCGVFGHRGPYGGCRHGGQAGGYVPFRACPPGWHIGFGGRHCFRNH